ncbi:Bud-site selection protein [Cytidiella melzeri]|nr:Bud-site selection protein [Cytidiella melzeri]
MLSSKIIATEVSSVVEALRIAVSPELKKEKARAADGDQEGDEDEDEVVPRGKKVKLGKNRVTDEEEEEMQSDASSRVLAFSDEEVDDGGWESGSIPEGSSERLELEGSVSDKDTDSVGEDNEADEGHIKPSTSSRKDPKSLLQSKSTMAQPEQLKKAGESTFLPSLAVGFTRGDSDASDLSDDDAGDTAPKKNRRGQRARRAIWEKKYGRNANHVKTQHETTGKGGPGDDWGGRGVQRSDRAQDKSRPRQAAPSWNPTQASRLPPPPSRAPPPHMQKEKKEEKGLHPSWVAKKQLKEKQNPSIVAPQGKKIVF